MQSQNVPRENPESQQGLSRRRELLIGRLRKRKTRQREGLYLAEGIRCAGAILDAGVDPRFAVCSPQLGSSEAGRRLADRLRRRELVEVQDTALVRLANTETPQGVLMVCEEARPEPGATLGAAKRLLLADGLQNPGNLGTLIRAAAAFGVDAVVALDGTVDPFNPKCVRASAGTVAQIDIVCASWRTAAPLIAAHPLLAASADGDPIVAGSNRWALAIGNEGAGPRAQILQRAARTVGVPIAASVESLNAAVAGAILMYALTREARQ